MKNKKIAEGILKRFQTELGKEQLQKIYTRSFSESEEQMTRVQRLLDSLDKQNQKMDKSQQFREMMAKKKEEMKS